MHISNSLHAKILAAVCMMSVPTYVSADENQTEPYPYEAQHEASSLFSEADGIIPFEDRSRRKWDSPVIADFDQDGHLDVLLQEHGQLARLHWNNGGTFSEAVDVIMGDTHGVAVGDVDMDGRTDLIIQRGGGDGKNPRNPVSFQINRDRTIEGGDEYEHFERSRGRATRLVDSDNNGTLDLILTAFPLKTQTDGANILYANNGQGTFEYVSHLPQAQWMGFKAILTDFDNDGISDHIYYGGSNMVAVRGGEGHTYTDVSSEVLGESTNTGFVSSIAEIDFDNDGDFDLFITRQDHPFEMETFFDADHGRFAFFARREQIQFDDLTIDGDFTVENLQMAYPHFDVMIGADKRKLQFEVERHGHKDFSVKPEEAEGWPADISDPGLYIGHLGDSLWRVSGETDSPTAAVILNVTSKPKTIDKESLPAILLENRDGVFVDVTEERGISIPEQTAGIAVGDFDNNGWSDLFVVRYGNPAKSNKQILYLNNGGHFTRSNNHGVVSKELGATGLGAEAFDYDQDGDLDLIYGNERGRWHLYTNNGLAEGTHNYVIVKVGWSPTQKATAIGATLTLHAGGQVYKRVVGATSAGFSQSANTHLHVGLGTCDKIDKATIQWTNGETEDLKIDMVNRSVTVGQSY